MIKKTYSNQSCGRDRESKMVRFLSPSVYKAHEEYESKKVYLNWPNLNSDNKLYVIAVEFVNELITHLNESVREFNLSRP